MGKNKVMWGLYSWKQIYPCASTNKVDNDRFCPYYDSLYFLNCVDENPDRYENWVIANTDIIKLPHEDMQREKDQMKMQKCVPSNQDPII